MATQAFFFDRAIRDQSRTVRLLKDGGIIAAGFFQDIPGVTITNNWSGANASFLSGLVDKFTSSFRSAAGQRVVGLIKENDFLSGFIGEDILSAVEKVQNSKITSVENMVKQYEGTQTNLQLENMVVAGVYSSSKDTYFPMVCDTLKAVDPRKLAYVLINNISGHYITGEEGDASTGDSDLDSDIYTIAKAGAEEGLWGVQLAPNGYTLDYKKALLGVIKGTFTLEIGDICKIDNIIITNVDVKMSPQCVAGTNKPLWVEMTISFDFAREFTMADYKQLFNIK